MTKSSCLFFAVFLCAAAVCAQPSLLAAEGSSAPELSLPGLDGQTYALSQYRGKQPVLLFFWTTWCPYCLKDIKGLNAQRQSYADRGLAILAVNAGENSAAVSRLVKNYKIELTMLLDERDDATRAFHVLGVPTFVVIDRQGMIRFKGNRFPRQELEDVLLPVQQ